MDASFVAFVFGAVNLALLGLLFLAWRRDRGSSAWRLKAALRLQEHDQRLSGLAGLLKEQDELRRVVRGEFLACLDGQAKELGALKKAVDALAVRLDVLELACGKKGGGETVNGTQGRSGWKTALQNWKTLLGMLKGLLMPLWRVLRRGM